MGKKVIILGGLGNGSVIANAIEDARMKGSNEWEMAGYLNDREQTGSKLQGFPILGKLSDAKKYINKGYYFINTIFRIDGQKERLDMFENLNIPESQLATFIHPSAYIAPNVELGPGTVIMPNTALSSGTVFGKGCLVMALALVGHDNVIGDYTHIAAHSCIGAYLNIGKGVHVGLNSTIRENITIGDFATIGMGAVLLKDVGESEIWAGNPAKLIRKAE